MAGQYRINKEKSKSRFYILLSIVFVFVLIKWGLPLFFNLVAGSGSPRVNIDKDVIPPQPPILNALPEATNSSSLLIEGYTEANAALDFLVNDQIFVTDRAKEDGSFSALVKLETGSSRVMVRAADEAGNISTSEIELITYDSNPVIITVSSPKDGTEFFGKNSQVIDIRGEVNKKEAQVVINNSFVLVNSDGTFVHRFQLQNGKNEIKVVASDKAGNSTEETFTLIYTP